MPKEADLSYAFGLPPEKAVEYFTSKGHRFSWDYRDTLDAAHAKAFTVAKTMQMDVLQDLRDGVRKAIADGITERQFIDELTPKLQAKGWWGRKEEVVPPKPGQKPTGEVREVQLGSPRRLKTIYRTNLQSAYMAGRWNDMWENREERPYWMYVAVMDQRTRPSHAALNGLVFRAEDPFWDTHYPPLAFNCRCRVRALSQSRLDAKGLTVESSEGNLVNEDVQVSAANGGTKTVTRYTNPKTGVSTAPDPGFNFNQGKAAWQPDLEKYDYEVARQYLEGAVTGPDFARFFEGKIGGTFPVGVLHADDMAALKSRRQTVLLSDTTVAEHKTAHPEIGLEDYQQISEIIGQGEVYKQGETKLIFLRRGEKFYRASIKRTQDGLENYFLTLFETSDVKAYKEVVKKYERIR